MKFQFKTLTTVFLISVFLLPSLSFGHGGGLDSYGCHHNRKAGGYHCHRGPLAGQYFSSKEEMLQKIKTKSVQEENSPQPSSSKYLVKAQVIEIIDGDTMDVFMDGEKVRVRLIGIDTPEVHESAKLHRDVERTGKDKQTIKELGAKASSFAKSLIGSGDYVHLEYDQDKWDKYSRLLAYVWLDNTRMLNEILICEGYANAYTQFPFKQEYMDRFRNCEREARELQKGLWNQ